MRVKSEFLARPSVGEILLSVTRGTGKFHACQERATWVADALSGAVAQILSTGDCPLSATINFKVNNSFASHFPSKKTITT